MQLIIQEKGKFKTVTIREGEVRYYTNDLTEDANKTFIHSSFLFLKRYFCCLGKFHIHHRGKKILLVWSLKENELHKNWTASGDILLCLVI